VNGNQIFPAMLGAIRSAKHSINFETYVFWDGQIGREFTEDKFGKTVTYMTSNGKVIEASKIRKDSKVRVHYLKDGDNIMVDKVIVTQDRD